MNMTVFYQKSKLALNGRSIRIGEDALPYADDSIVIAADGLGGRGGYPHLSLNKDVLDEQRLFDVMFDGVFENPVDEDFKAYVLKSFQELFDTKDFYENGQQNLSYLRTSGYFASRIVTAIALYTFKYDEEFEKNKLFDKLSEAPEAAIRDHIAQDIANSFTKKLKQKLQTVVDNVGFVCESRVKGNYLLPSTLSVTVMREQEDHVETLFLWAGDSRAYFWNSNGLKQITEDHERFETMTNLITLSKPDFVIEGHYLKDELKKPCLIFNASDGCYKCPVFGSPFDLEYVFVDALKNAESFEEAASVLESTFEQIGTHDDSNTMALKAFGYVDYAAVRQAAIERIEGIDTTYVTALPDILTRDYAGELDAAQTELEEELSRDNAFIDGLLGEEVKANAYAEAIDALCERDPSLNKVKIKGSSLKKIKELDEDAIEELFNERIAELADIDVSSVEKEELKAIELELKRDLDEIGEDLYEDGDTIFIEQTIEEILDDYSRVTERPVEEDESAWKSLVSLIEKERIIFKKGDVIAIEGDKKNKIVRQSGENWLGLANDGSHVFNDDMIGGGKQSLRKKKSKIIEDIVEAIEKACGKVASRVKKRAAILSKLNQKDEKDFIKKLISESKKIKAGRPSRKIARNELIPRALENKELLSEQSLSALAAYKSARDGYDKRQAVYGQYESEYKKLYHKTKFN